MNEYKKKENGNESALCDSVLCSVIYVYTAYFGKCSILCTFVESKCCILLDIKYLIPLKSDFEGVHVWKCVHMLSIRLISAVCRLSKEPPAHLLWCTAVNYINSWKQTPYCVRGPCVKIWSTHSKKVSKNHQAEC